MMPDPDRLAMPRVPEATAVAVLDTFVAGLGAHAATSPALARLRAGAPLDLRRTRRGGSSGAGAAPTGTAGGGQGGVEVWTAEGHPLGRLPPEDAQAFDRLAVAGGRPVSARVSAVVPAFRRPRVQVRIAFALPEDGRGGRGAGCAPVEAGW